MVKTKLAKVFIASVFTMLIIFSTAITAFAADTVKINGTEKNIGDTITYILKMNCNKKVAGIDMVVSFDSNSLELMKDTVNTPALSTVICNKDESGKIIFNAVDANKGFDFSKNQILISASFKVKDGAVAESEIKYSMTEIIDIDLADIDTKSYTLEESCEQGTLPAAEIVNPGDGKAEMASAEAALGNNEQKQTPITTQGVVLICVASLLVILIIVAVIYKKVTAKKHIV